MVQIWQRREDNRTVKMEIYLTVFMLIAGIGAGRAVNVFFLRRMGYSGCTGAEIMNGIAWALLSVFSDISVTLVCFLAAVPCLLVLSAADFQTYEIPREACIFLWLLGAVRFLFSDAERIELLAGIFCISVPLYVIYWVSRGTAIGLGDIRLMAAAGFLLGGSGIVLAFVTACVTGTVVHLFRMRYQGVGNRLAFGPYLALGIWFSMVWGERLSAWYMKGLLGGWQ